MNRTIRNQNNGYCNDPKCEITREGIPHNHKTISKSPILSKNITDYFMYFNGDIWIIGGIALVSAMVWIFSSQEMGLSFVMLEP